MWGRNHRTLLALYQHHPHPKVTAGPAAKIQGIAAGSGVFVELSSGPRAVFAPAQQPAAHLAGWALCLLPTAPARGGAAARLLSPASHVGQGSSEQWAVVCCCIFAAAPNRGRAPPGSGRDFRVMSQCCRWAETGCAARVSEQRQVSVAARWTGAAAAAGPQWITLEFHLPRPIIPIHFTEEFPFLNHDLSSWRGNMVDSVGSRRNILWGTMLSRRIKLVVTRSEISARGCHWAYSAEISYERLATPRMRARYSSFLYNASSNDAHCGVQTRALPPLIFQVV